MIVEMNGVMISLASCFLGFPPFPPLHNYSTLRPVGGGGYHNANIWPT